MENIMSINNEQIKNLTFEEFVKTLEYVNLRLRGKLTQDEETGIYKENMFVDGLVSPSNEMQMIILKKLFETLKENIDLETKGLICYYTLNNLHLFKDGNGRTSRYFYQFFNNNFNQDYLYHENGKENTSKRYEFEKDNNLLNVTEFFNIVNYNIFKNKIAEGLILDSEKLREYTTIKTFFPGVEGKMDTSWLPNELNTQLGSQSEELIRNLANNNCNFPLGGISMCIILTKMNLLQNYIDINNLSTQTDIGLYRPLVFHVGTEDKEDFESHVCVENWDLQTCLDYVHLNEKLLIEQFDMIVEISRTYSNKKQNEDVKQSNDELAQLREEILNENISKPTAEELEKLREEYIKMMSSGDIDFYSVRPRF